MKKTGNAFETAYEAAVVRGFDKYLSIHGEKNRLAYKKDKNQLAPSNNVE